MVSGQSRSLVVVVVGIGCTGTIRADKGEVVTNGVGSGSAEVGAILRISYRPTHRCLGILIVAGIGAGRRKGIDYRLSVVLETFGVAHAGIEPDALGGQRTLAPLCAVGRTHEEIIGRHGIEPFDGEDVACQRIIGIDDISSIDIHRQSVVLCQVVVFARYHHFPLVGGLTLPRCGDAVGADRYSREAEGLCIGQGEEFHIVHID